MLEKTRGKNVDVHGLFHGITSVYIDVICQHGFDWRVCGSSHVTWYGKGSYFACDASYAKDYVTGCRKNVCGKCM